MDQARGQPQGAPPLLYFVALLGWLVWGERGREGGWGRGRGGDNGGTGKKEVRGGGDLRETVLQACGRGLEEGGVGGGDVV
jgi:hypothetical protein